MVIYSRYSCLYAEMRMRDCITTLIKLNRSALSRMLVGSLDWNYTFTARTQRTRELNNVFEYKSSHILAAFNYVDVEYGMISKFLLLYLWCWCCNWLGSIRCFIQIKCQPINDYEMVIPYKCISQSLSILELDVVVLGRRLPWNARNKSERNEENAHTHKLTRKESEEKKMVNLVLIIVCLVQC